MDQAMNPFAPGAGTQPPELTGRDSSLAEARVTLSRVLNSRPTRSLLLVGLRGVGKTVLLNKIKSIADEDFDYETVLIESPETKPLAELLIPPLRKLFISLDKKAERKEKLYEAAAALQSFASVFKIKIGEMTFSVDRAVGTADSGVLEEDLTDLFVSLGYAAKESGTGIGIFIDELQYVQEEELAALLAAIHRVGQLNLPLVTFGAGLPQLAGLTGNAKSYAERLFNFQKIDKLQALDAKKAISEPLDREGVSIESDALDLIVHQTEGYPYFLQEWGQHSWNIADNSPITLQDVKAATGEAIETLDDGFFRVRFDRLTPSEKIYLRAMAELGSGPHRSGDIANVLTKAVQLAAPTRANIIKKGMIFAPSHGDTAFTVPKFDEYMKRVMPKLG